MRGNESMGMWFFKKLLGDKTIKKLINSKIMHQKIGLMKSKSKMLYEFRIYCFRIYTQENQIKHRENNVTSKTNPKFYVKRNKYKAGHNKMILINGNITVKLPGRWNDGAADQRSLSSVCECEREETVHRLVQCKPMGYKPVKKSKSATS